MGGKFNDKTRISRIYGWKSWINKGRCYTCIRRFCRGVTTGIVNKGKVSLVGFLTFEKKEREERSARNPRTGETIKIPARSVVTVKVGSKLKEAVK